LGRSIELKSDEMRHIAEHIAKHLHQ
jgi:hypothetical protein